MTNWLEGFIGRHAGTVTCDLKLALADCHLASNLVQALVCPCGLRTVNAQHDGLTFHLYIHLSYFATVHGNEPLCSLVGPLALTHLSGERAAEVRICSPESNRLWLSMVRCDIAGFLWLLLFIFNKISFFW